jgi:hypothetical protein
MDTYHGTSAATAIRLTVNGVDVTVGGGELGRGFYTGEHIHEAKAWAFQRYGDKQRNVVRFSTPDYDVERLSFAVLDHGSAALKRYHIKQTDQTRTYRFGLDMVWAPIVGSERASGDQYKWESATAQSLLNNPKTGKFIV